MTTPAQAAAASTSTSEEQEALQASIFQRLHPKAYLERFLAEGFRPDGRKLDGRREVSVNTGSISTADGSALVRLGNTTVVCGVKAEIAEPELDAGTRGFLVPNLDLPAMCSPRFKPGPPSDEAQVLSDRLNEALISSGILPLESLCIHPNKSVWVLYVDATCINYDGNAFDATLLAMVAALQNTRLPKATYDETTRRTVCLRGEAKVPLEIGRVPVSASFGIFDSNKILADPTAFEEPLLDTTLTVAVDAESLELISATQHGLGSASVDAVRACVAQAKEAAGGVVELLLSKRK